MGSCVHQSRAVNTSSYSRLLSKSLITQRPSVPKTDRSMAVSVYITPLRERQR